MTSPISVSEVSKRATSPVDVDADADVNVNVKSLPKRPRVQSDYKEDTEKLASVITNVPSQHEKYIFLLEARGGTDKDPKTGHRRDSIPIAEAIASSKKCGTAVLSILEEEINIDINIDKETALNNKQSNDALRDYIFRKACGLVVRVNPGTLTPSTQSKLDAMLCEFASSGIIVMSHPDVQRRMGAKDALCKIKHLNCGMEDTEVFYEADTFGKGFLKSIAFRPRVIKQNRGSQGEGIWIVKLKTENYCEKYGDRSVDLDEELVLMEANDNHVEYHTAGEFIEFCINGRTEKSGTWESTGTGKYLEGGVESGAMLVDQRFLPRVVEGEVRCLMVGQKLVGIVHKKPKEGGYSATLQSGAVYTSYEPDAPEFESLVKAFKSDLPKIMTSFGIADQQLPLLWTADFMYGDKDKQGKDSFYVGEFNCACVGITQQLHFADLVGKTAVETCFPSVENKCSD